jgi:hypothetical protein
VVSFASSESTYIGRLGFMVRLVGEPHAVAAICDQVHPYFVVGQQPSMASQWTVYAGTAYSPDLAGARLYDRPSPGERSRRWWVNSARNWIVVDQPAGAWLQLYTIRIIRNLIRWQMLGAGAMHLHAGGIALNGRGVGILGPPRSGKTSLALCTIAQYGMGYLAEDDMTLMAESSNVLGLGWPGSTRLRWDSLRSIEAISKRADLETLPTEHPGNAASVRRSPDDVAPPEGWRLRLFPKEVARLFGAPLYERAAIDTLLFLEPALNRAEHPTLSELSSSEAADPLRRNCDFAAERRPGARIAAVPSSTDWEAIAYDSFLAGQFVPPDTEAIAAQLDGVTRRTTSYRLRFSYENLERATELVAQILK